MCVAVGLGLGLISAWCPEMNYDVLRAERGDVRSLVESLFRSVRSLSCGYVYSPSFEGFAAEIAVMFLANSIAFLVRLKQRNSKI